MGLGGLAGGLVLGLRVRPPDLFRSAGPALLVPGAALVVATLVTLPQALAAGYFAFEFLIFLPGATPRGLAGLGLWRRDRWGWRLTLVAAAIWAVVAVALLAVSGTPFTLLYSVGPVLLCAGVAAATRKELPAPEPRRRIMRGGRH